MWQGASVVGGHVWQGGMRGRGTCVAGGVHGGRGMYGRGSMHGRGHSWQGACVACMHVPPPPPTDTTKYGDTVNEQAVRILLECILVFYSFR